MSDHLKRCQFDGEQPEIYLSFGSVDEYIIKCPNQICNGGTIICNGREKAIEAWNRRTAEGGEND